MYDSEEDDCSPDDAPKPKDGAPNVVLAARALDAFDLNFLLMLMRLTRGSQDIKGTQRQRGLGGALV